MHLTDYFIIISDLKMIMRDKLRIIKIMTAVDREREIDNIFLDGLNGWRITENEYFYHFSNIDNDCRIRRIYYKHPVYKADCMTFTPIKKEIEIDNNFVRAKISMVGDYILNESHIDDSIKDYLIYEINKQSGLIE